MVFNTRLGRSIIIYSTATPLDEMTPALPGANCIATDHRANAVIDTTFYFTSVNPTHRAFKAKIAEIIKKKVVYVEGKELASDSVICILGKELPECKGLSRTSLLRNASAILGCKLTHKRKPRYEDL